MFNTVRVRLTLWYLVVFGSLLALFSVLVYMALSRAIYSRLDRFLSNNAQTTALFLEAEMREQRDDPLAGAVEALDELTLPDVHSAVFQGRRLAISKYPEGEPVVVPEAAFRATEETERPALATVDGFGEEGARLALLRVRVGEETYFVALAQSLHETVEQLEALSSVFYVAVPAALLLASIGGLLLARKSLAPVARMTEQAARISSANWSERLEVVNPGDELGRLATVFNDLLERLNGSFENMRRFMADASHELRTPLAIIRGEADVALSQRRDPAEYQEALAVIQDEARRLSAIVDDMLALARADAGQRPLKVEEFYLNDLVEECARAAQVLALRKQVALQVESAEDLAFRGDEDLLRRMILNLLDNAIKYTPAGGSVSVKLATEGGAAKITVADTGVGIPAESAAHVFDRFYRAGRSRSRADGGSGLGLAIAKWVAEAHNGTISLRSEPGQGASFFVRLPL